VPSEKNLTLVVFVVCFRSMYHPVRKVGPLRDVDPSQCHLLQFDGGSRGNPGLAGYGFVIFGPGDRKKIVEKGERIIYATNNVAEYEGLIAGLAWAAEKGIMNLVVEGDSMLIIEQLKGNYKAGKMRESHIRAMALCASFDYIAVRHIYRNANVLADLIVNEAIDNGPLERSFAAARVEAGIENNLGFLTYVSVQGI